MSNAGRSAAELRKAIESYRALLYGSTAGDINYSVGPRARSKSLETYNIEIIKYAHLRLFHVLQ